MHLLKYSVISLSITAISCSDSVEPGSQEDNNWYACKRAAEKALSLPCLSLLNYNDDVIDSTDLTCGGAFGDVGCCSNSHFLNQSSCVDAGHDWETCFKSLSSVNTSTETERSAPEGIWLVDPAGTECISAYACLEEALTCPSGPLYHPDETLLNDINQCLSGSSSVLTYSELSETNWWKNGCTINLKVNE